MESSAVVELRLLRLLAPEIFSSVCGVAARTNIYPTRAQFIEDENEHEYDCEKSMSRDENVHPYRGLVNELDLDNEELQNALTDFYRDHKKSHTPNINLALFKLLLRNMLHLESVKID